MHINFGLLRKQVVRSCRVTSTPPSKSSGEAVKHADKTFISVVKLLDTIGSPYCVLGRKAAEVQGVPVTSRRLKEVQTCEIVVQWDYFKTIHTELKARSLSVEPLMTKGAVSSFAVNCESPEPSISVFCRSGTFVASDTHRIAVKHPSGQVIYCRSLQAVLQGAQNEAFGSQLFAMGPESLSDQELAGDIRDFLKARQKEIAAHNLLAWGNEDAFDAWLHRFGSPQESSCRIVEDPGTKLGPLYPHISHLLQSQPEGTSKIRIANLFGSHGSKSVALCLLDACIDVTVVDIGLGNRKYGTELAAAAGVSERLEYVTCDVLDLDLGAFQQHGQDAVLMEMGCLHYLIHLEPLMRVIASILKPKGRLILREFHPITTKLISSSKGKQKVTGNYFSSDLSEVDVAYSKQLNESRDRRTVLERHWNLGEVVTAVASAGLRIMLLEEEGGVRGSDEGIPKTYILIAEKP